MWGMFMDIPPRIPIAPNVEICLFKGVDSAS
jgi:hypothetical protein